MKVLVLLIGVIANFNLMSAQCLTGQVPCSAVIQGQQSMVIYPQQTMVTCWAASARAIFKYYGHDVDESTIVIRTIGSIPTTASPLTMIKMLNASYVDTNGNTFTVRTPKIYDGMNWLSANPQFMSQIGATPFTNNDLVIALQSGRPVMMGTKTHAMVITQMDYYNSSGFISPVAAWALDPTPSPVNPQLAIGLRQLQPYEMTAFFGADVVVSP